MCFKTFKIFVAFFLGVVVGWTMASSRMTGGLEYRSDDDEEQPELEPKLNLTEVMKVLKNVDTRVLTILGVVSTITEDLRRLEEEIKNIKTSLPRTRPSTKPSPFMSVQMMDP